MAAEQQMKLMRETPPESKHYNLMSALMIAFGGVGISMVLKYQDKFKEILPEWALVEQPYPGDSEKIYIGKQSQYYYSQSLYFQALSGWTIVFLKRSRMISPLYYLQASIACLIGTYLTNYYKRPNQKHSLWFLFNMFFGFTLGSYFHQQGFKVFIDALYLIGNSMTVYAASTYYGPKENPGILLTAVGSMFFGMIYGVGVLRLFRWGLVLNDWKLYPIAATVLSLLLSWSIYRSLAVQEEYNATNFNPINASLSYQWKQIPQINVFVDAFYHNHKKQLKKLLQNTQEQLPAAMIVDVKTLAPDTLAPEAITPIIATINNDSILDDNGVSNNGNVSLLMWQPMGTQSQYLYSYLMKSDQQIHSCRDIMSSQAKLLMLMRGGNGDNNNKDSNGDKQQIQQQQIKQKQRKNIQRGNSDDKNAKSQQVLLGL